MQIGISRLPQNATEGAGMPQIICRQLLNDSSGGRMLFIQVSFNQSVYPNPANGNLPGSNVD